MSKCGGTDLKLLPEEEGNLAYQNPGVSQISCGFSLPTYLFKEGLGANFAKEQQNQDIPAGHAGKQLIMCNLIFFNSVLVF